MKKSLSGMAILFMLVFKYPPLPKYSLLHKTEIIQVCRLSIRQLASRLHFN